MLIFSEKNTANMYIFLHIPKNSGRYMRNQICIKFDTHNCPINNNNISLLDITNNEFKVHCNYITIKKYYPTNYKIITFIRNPYDRCISIFFHIYKIFESIDNFKKFLKTQLINFLELDEYHKFWFTPQVNYILNSDGEIPNDITIYKLEEYTSESEVGKFLQFKDFQLKKYDYSLYLDTECIEIINKVYNKDFIILNYEKIKLNG